MPDSPQPSRRQRYLGAMGVDVWQRRASGAQSSGESRAAARPRPETAVPAHGAATTRDAAGVDVAAMPLAALADTVSACQRCELHRGRQNTVFGTGDEHARCMIIGEAPGADEDARGEPFVGRAGKLLNAMLRAIGMSRESVYIANIIKCRPPKNRDPKAEEMVACAPYLRRQIAMVKPRVIVAVGRVAAQHLAGSTAPIGKMRGQRHYYDNSDDNGGDRARIPMVVTYHPAYLLRSPLEKRKAWEDLRRLRALLEAQP